MRIPKLLIIIPLISFVVIVGVFWIYQREISRRLDVSEEAIYFSVEPGDGAKLISLNLEKERIVSSSLIFQVYLKVNGLAGDLKAGVYKIPANSSMVEVADILIKGTFDVKVTFPEGWRKEEMAIRLEKQFLDETGREGFGREFLDAALLEEGYLFPDTYYVPQWYSARQLVEMMKDNYKKKLNSIKNSTGSASRITDKDATILASIVEREARFDEDRPLIAGILLKRLENDWPLDVDATLQYALAEITLKKVDLFREKVNLWPSVTTAADLKIDSPYNSRKNLGLPPSPISNPGVESLRAVYFPKLSGNWFYLSTPDGKTYYSKTLEEHSLNVRKYLSN